MRFSACALCVLGVLAPSFRPATAQSTTARLLSRPEEAWSAEVARLVATARRARASGTAQSDDVLDLIELRARQAETRFSERDARGGEEALAEAQAAERLLERRLSRLRAQEQVRVLEVRIATHRREAQPSHTRPPDVSTEGTLAERTAEEERVLAELERRRETLEGGLRALREEADARAEEEQAARETERLRLARASILAAADRAMALAATYEGRARRRYAANELSGAKEAAWVLAARLRVGIAAHAALHETTGEHRALEAARALAEGRIEREPVEALLALDRLRRRFEGLSYE